MALIALVWISRHSEINRAYREQIPLTPAHVPDVAAHEGHHMRLPQMGYAVVDRTALKPAVGDLQAHVGSPSA